MEPRRPIKELLTIMLENQHLFSEGLCFWCTRMMRMGIISFDERDFLLKYIYDNRPTGLLSYFNKDGHFFWEMGVIYQRIKWIKKHIKKLS